MPVWASLCHCYARSAPVRPTPCSDTSLASPMYVQKTPSQCSFDVRTPINGYGVSQLEQLSTIYSWVLCFNLASGLTTDNLKHLLRQILLKIVSSDEQKQVLGYILLLFVTGGNRHRHKKPGTHLSSGEAGLFTRVREYTRLLIPMYTASNITHSRALLI